MVVTSNLEEYIYVWRKRDVDYIALIIAELEALKIRYMRMKGKLPIVGILKPQVWKEFSMNDFIYLR